MIHTLRERSAGGAISVLCAILFIILLIASKEANEGTRRGLELCLRTLIPSLFPFMVISELIVRTGAFSGISHLTGGAMNRLFGVSCEGASALLLGIICGFPVGAKAAASLYSSARLTKRECEHLLSFCNFPSAPFMIFAVGEGMFGDRKIGVFLYLTALSSGLLYGYLSQPRGQRNFAPAPKEARFTRCNAFSAFTSSVVSAAHSVISVCAFVTFFSCATNAFSALLGKAVSPLGNAMLCSFFELTSGAAACAAVPSRNFGVILAAAGCGWSGLSVLLQIYSLTRTDGEELSLLPYIRSKIFCSIFCAGAATLYIRVFPNITQSNCTAGEAFSAAASYPRYVNSFSNIIFISALLICFYKLLDRKRKI